MIQPPEGAGPGPDPLGPRSHRRRAAAWTRDAAPRRPVLIVPGLHDSLPGHWQHLWLRDVPGALKVTQADWDRPTLGEWVAELVTAVRRHPGAVLVGHSLGCALIAHVARLRGGRDIAGALLVAPAEVRADGPAGALLAGFGPMPLEPLHFPAVVVASRSDPYVRFDRARTFANHWGAELVDAGDAGHINIASGYGPWPRGDAILSKLLARVSEQPWPNADLA